MANEPAGLSEYEQALQRYVSRQMNAAAALAVLGHDSIEYRAYRAAADEARAALDALVRSLLEDRERLREALGQHWHHRAVEYEGEPWCPPASAAKGNILPGDHTEWPCMTCLWRVDEMLDAARRVQEGSSATERPAAGRAAELEYLFRAK